MKIGIFDSGIGGLTVLERLLKEGFSQSYIYLCDNKNSPFGNKKIEEIKDLVFKGVKTLISKGVDLVVLACNTASVTCLSEVKTKYSIPVFGITPPLSEGEKPRAIFSTSATAKALEKKAVDWDIIPLSFLATLLDFDFSSREIFSYLDKNLPKENYKTVVLGCTHFPFAKSIFKDKYPQAKILDGGDILIQNLSLFFDKIKGNPLVEIEFIFTGEDKTEYSFSALKFLLEGQQI